MPPSGRSRWRTARAGERLAALWLWLKGYRIVDRNWRCQLGELDIVCRRHDMVVFIEVRTRLGTTAGTPEASVDRRKREQVVRVARAYLSRRRLAGMPVRFDVVAVRAGWPPLRHLRGAFVAEPQR